MKKIDLSTTHIMGILNLTDNSFYDGNKYNTQEKAINQVRKMIKEGATIIDIELNLQNQEAKKFLKQKSGKE